MVEPRVVQLLVTRRRPEIPDDRITATRDESKTDQLVDRPRADMRRRGITKVGDIETQQRTQRRLLQRLVQPGQPLHAQPIHVDTNFPIDTVRTKRADRHSSVLRNPRYRW